MVASSQKTHPPENLYDNLELVWWSSEFCAGQKFINIAQISVILSTWKIAGPLQWTHRVNWIVRSQVPSN